MESEPGLGSISGVVRGYEEAGLPGVRVALKHLGSGQSLPYEYTDDAGAYRFDELLPGEYWLDLSHSDDGYSSDWTTVGWQRGELVLGFDQDRTGVDARFAARNASISGVVTYADGTPVQQGRVYVQGSSSGSVNTDDAGAYRVEGLGPGAHTVQFFPAGSRASEYLAVYWKDSLSFATADPLEIGEGQSISDIDAQLPLGGSLSGVLTMSDGTPVADALVEVEGETVHTGRKSTRTDASGRYRFAGLVTAGYLLAAYPKGCVNRGYWPAGGGTNEAETIPVTLGAETTTDMELEPGATISGTVTWAPGHSPDVDLVTAKGSHVRSANIAADGSYEFCVPKPLAGGYAVEFSQLDWDTMIRLPEYWNDQDHLETAEVIMLAPGDVVTGIDAELTTGSTISGTVTGDGLPVSHVMVTAHGEIDGGTAWTRYTSTDSAGAYTLGYLPSGTYTLEFEPRDGSVYTDEWWGNRPDRDSAVRFDVAKDAIVSGMDLELSPGASITGVLVDARGGPVPGAEVYAYLSGVEPLDRRFGQVDESGVFVIPGLGSGVYSVTFSAPGYFTQYGTTVEVAARSEASIGEIELVPFARISGKVVGEGGYRLGQSAYVRLYRLEAGTYRWVDSDATGNYAGMPAWDGVFDFPSLRAGTYKVEFRPPSGYRGEWWSDAPDEASATIIELGVGEARSGVDAELAGGPVRITGPKLSGTPVVGATLTAAVSTTTADASLALRWLANGAPIEGATGETLRLAAGQLGARISLQATGTAPGHTSTTATSPSTSVVGLGTISLDGPAISGVAKVGETLTAVASSSTEGVRIEYRWFAGGTAVDGAVDQAFTPGTAHVGMAVTVRVTASAPGFATIVRTSDRTAPVESNVRPPPERPADVEWHGPGDDPLDQGRQDCDTCAWRPE
ncbi:carboxypeptidase regulatory-like domain-containing protein [Agromyces sp. SYSU T0242]|uniref:carboxypeptidase regulatory-like domain-containing protein n=1 Tax=Agromyces litoreus TaxID=3158561 RepID=UPI0033946103